MNRYEQLANLLKDVEPDFSKFYEKENQAAGTRIRKKMQEMKNLAQEIRLEVQEIKNTRTAEETKSK
ncbi:MAG: histone H1 [Bernardetiaceae bacterium]|nr:histone H1 [Bernardetiaceae bacterium]